MPGRGLCLPEKENLSPSRQGPDFLARLAGLMSDIGLLKAAWHCGRSTCRRLGLKSKVLHIPPW
jgi:hypothetical protein